MDTASHVVLDAVHLYARASNTTTSDPASSLPPRPPIYKVVGIVLAITSGLFIGVSFVIKKIGLLKANEKYDEEAGEGYGYLKNAWWWTGMTLMILGEICNFAAYMFVDAIMVTPLGALSVVITTILSAIFLKERLSFVGKVSCFLCIIGSVVIVLNAPEQSAVADIQQMQHFVIAPGFLVYTGIVIIGCLFTIFWAGPRYGKKTMLVYLTVCSMIGGLSVVATQGLGSAILAQINGKPQFNQWFIYVLLVFVICTLLTEIVYLNVSGLGGCGSLCDTDHLTESPQHLQCRAGHANLLRVFHLIDDRRLSDLVQRLQGNCGLHHNSGSGLPGHLRWSSAVTTRQKLQGRARHRSLQGRARPSTHNGRARRARI
jgi:uncharacterized membrane protein